MAELLALITLVLIASIIMTVEAQSAPSPSSCSSALASLSPCLSFLAGYNNPSTSAAPTQSCCSAVTDVANNSADCLCPLFTGNTTSNLLGFPVNNIPLPLNQARAVTLPGACQVSTPLLSQCKVSGGGAGAPVATPVATPVSSPAAARAVTATSSPSPATTSIAPASSVDSTTPALAPAPAATGGVLSPAKAPVTSTALPPTTATTGAPSSSHVKPTGSVSAGSMMSFSMSSMLIVGVINVIVSIL